ncbi:MAG TPA: response regulator transcription factor [Bacteroidales bacterium]|nr:response regulator transcription factor [Bacteroidales bacterium]
MIDVLIVEDHPVVVEGMKKLLLDSGLTKLCVTASNGNEALTYLQNFSPDIVLLDINLPDVNGIDLCKTMMHRYPGLKILAISSFSQRSYILRMIESGSMGYVLKNSSEEEIIAAINDVIAGKKHLGFEVNEILKQDKADGGPILSRRETEVLKFIADGFTNQEIADKMFISPLTVDSHRKNLLMKMNARNTAALIKIAISKGLIEAE